MNETAASSFVANLPVAVEELEELLAAKKAAAKKAEAPTIMQLNPPRKLLKSCHWTAQAQLFDCKLTVSQDCGSSNVAQ